MEGRRPTMVRMARGAPQGGMVGRGHRACWLMRGMIRARKRAPLSIHCLFTVGQWGSPGVSLSGRYALPHHCARASRGPGGHKWHEQNAHHNARKMGAPLGPGRPAGGPGVDLETPC